MNQLSKTSKKTDSHKRIALQMQGQADSLIDNINIIMSLAKEIDNKQLLLTCERALSNAKDCFSEVLAIRTIITRDC